MRTGLIAGTAALIVVMIFIIQNAHAVNITFLGAHLHLSLAVALLLAAVAGALVMAAAGTARITQLRRIMRRNRRNPQPASIPDNPANSRARAGRSRGLPPRRAACPATPATAHPRTPLTKESVMGIIAWIVLGLAAGLLANMLIPGKRSQGLILTCLIGIAGALGGGWAATELFHVHTLHGFFNLSTWLTAIAGSAVLLLASRLLTGRSGKSRRLAHR